MWYLKVLSSLIIVVSLNCLVQNTNSIDTESEVSASKWTSLASSTSQSDLKQLTKLCEKYLSNFNQKLENTKTLANIKLSGSNNTTTDIVNLTDNVKSQVKVLSSELVSVRKLVQKVALRFRDKFKSILSFTELVCEPINKELEIVKKITIDKKNPLVYQVIKSFGNRYDLQKLADKVLEVSSDSEKFKDNYNEKKKVATREFSLLWKSLDNHAKTINDDALGTLSIFFKGMDAVKSIRKQIKTLGEDALSKVIEENDLSLLKNAVELAKALKLKFEDEWNLDSAELTYSEEQRNVSLKKLVDEKFDVKEIQQDISNDNKSTNDVQSDSKKAQDKKNDNDKIDIIKSEIQEKQDTTGNSSNEIKENIPIKDTSIIPETKKGTVVKTLREKKTLLPWDELIKQKNPLVSQESKKCVDILETTTPDLDNIKLSAKNIIQAIKDYNDLQKSENDIVQKFYKQMIDTSAKLADSLVNAADDVCAKVTPINKRYENKFKNDPNIKRVQYLLGKKYDPNQYILKILDEVNNKHAIGGMKKTVYYKMLSVAYNLKNETKDMDDTALYAMNKIHEGKLAASDLRKTFSKEKASKACFIRSILMEKENDNDITHKDENREKLKESMNDDNIENPFITDINLDLIDKMELPSVKDEEEPKISNEDETNISNENIIPPNTEKLIKSATNQSTEKVKQRHLISEENSNMNEVDSKKNTNELDKSPNYILKRDENEVVSPMNYKNNIVQQKIPRTHYTKHKNINNPNDVSIEYNTMEEIEDNEKKDSTQRESSEIKQQEYNKDKATSIENNNHSNLSEPKNSNRLKRYRKTKHPQDNKEQSKEYDTVEEEDEDNPEKLKNSNVSRKPQVADKIENKNLLPNISDHVGIKYENVQNYKPNQLENEQMVETPVHESNEEISTPYETNGISDPKIIKRSNNNHRKQNNPKDVQYISKEYETVEENADEEPEELKNINVSVEHELSGHIENKNELPKEPYHTNVKPQNFQEFETGHIDNNQIVVNPEQKSKEEITTPREAVKKYNDNEPKSIKNEKHHRNHKNPKEGQEVSGEYETVEDDANENSKELKKVHEPEKSTRADGIKNKILLPTEPAHVGVGTKISTEHTPNFLQNEKSTETPELASIEESVIPFKKVKKMNDIESKSIQNVKRHIQHKTPKKIQTISDEYETLEEEDNEEPEISEHKHTSGEPNVFDNKGNKKELPREPDHLGITPDDFQKFEPGYADGQQIVMTPELTPKEKTETLHETVESNIDSEHKSTKKVKLNRKHKNPKEGQEISGEHETVEEVDEDKPDELERVESLFDSPQNLKKDHIEKDHDLIVDNLTQGNDEDDQVYTSGEPEMSLHNTKNYKLPTEPDQINIKPENSWEIEPGHVDYEAKVVTPEHTSVEEGNTPRIIAEFNSDIKPKSTRKVKRYTKHKNPKNNQEISEEFETVEEEAENKHEELERIESLLKEPTNMEKEHIQNNHDLIADNLTQDNDEENKKAIKPKHINKIKYTKKHNIPKNGQEISEEFKTEEDEDEEKPEYTKNVNLSDEPKITDDTENVRVLQKKPDHLEIRNVNSQEFGPGHIDNEKIEINPEHESKEESATPIEAAENKSESEPKSIKKVKRHRKHNNPKESQETSGEYETVEEEDEDKPEDLERKKSLFDSPQNMEKEYIQKDHDLIADMTPSNDEDKTNVIKPKPIKRVKHTRKHNIPMNGQEISEEFETETENEKSEDKNNNKIQSNEMEISNNSEIKPNIKSIHKFFTLSEEKDHLEDKIPNILNAPEQEVTYNNEPYSLVLDDNELFNKYMKRIPDSISGENESDKLETSNSPYKDDLDNLKHFQHNEDNTEMPNTEDIKYKNTQPNFTEGEIPLNTLLKGVGENPATTVEMYGQKSNELKIKKNLQKKSKSPKDEYEVQQYVDSLEEISTEYGTKKRKYKNKKNSKEGEVPNIIETQSPVLNKQESQIDGSSQLKYENNSAETENENLDSVEGAEQIGVENDKLIQAIESYENSSSAQMKEDDELAYEPFNDKKAILDNNNNEIETKNLVPNDKPQIIARYEPYKANTLNDVVQQQYASNSKSIKKTRHHTKHKDPENRNEISEEYETIEDISKKQINKQEDSLVSKETDKYNMTTEKIFKNRQNKFKNPKDEYEVIEDKDSVEEISGENDDVINGEQNKKNKQRVQKPNRIQNTTKAPSEFSLNENTFPNKHENHPNMEKIEPVNANKNKPTKNEIFDNGDVPVKTFIEPSEVVTEDNSLPNFGDVKKDTIIGTPPKGRRRRKVSKAKNIDENNTKPEFANKENSLQYISSESRDVNNPIIHDLNNVIQKNIPQPETKNSATVIMPTVFENNNEQMPFNVVLGDVSDPNSIGDEASTPNGVDDINNIIPHRVTHGKRVRKPKNNNENNIEPESANNEFDPQNIPTENIGENDHTGIPDIENYDQENVPETGDNEMIDTAEPNVLENYNEQEPSYLWYKDTSIPNGVDDIYNIDPRKIRHRRRVKRPKYNNENNIEPEYPNNELDSQNSPTENRGVNDHTGIPNFENYIQENNPETGDNKLTDITGPNVTENYNQQEPSYLGYDDILLPNGVDDIKNINPHRVRHRRRVRRPKYNYENIDPVSAYNESDPQNIPTNNRGVNNHTGIPEFENYDQENVPETGDNELIDTVEPNVLNNYNEQEPSYLAYDDTLLPNGVDDINNINPRRVRRRRRVKKPKNNNENNTVPESANNEFDSQNIPTENRGVNDHTGIPNFENYDQENVLQTVDNELTETVDPNVPENYNQQEPSYLGYEDASMPKEVYDINNNIPRRVRRRRRVQKPKNNNENNTVPESANKGLDSQNIPTENGGVNDHTGIPNFENYIQENNPETGDNELTDITGPNVPENYNQQEPSYLGYDDILLPNGVDDIKNINPHRVKHRRRVRRPKYNYENIDPVSAYNEFDPQNIPTENIGENDHTGIPDIENYDQENVPETGDNEMIDTAEPNVLENYNEQEPSYLWYKDTSIPNGVDDIYNIDPRKIRHRRRVKRPKYNNENNIEPEYPNNELDSQNSPTENRGVNDHTGIPNFENYIQENNPETGDNKLTDITGPNVTENYNQQEPSYLGYDDILLPNGVDDTKNINPHRVRHRRRVRRPKYNYENIDPVSAYNESDPQNIPTDNRGVNNHTGIPEFEYYHQENVPETGDNELIDTVEPNVLNNYNEQEPSYLAYDDTLLPNGVDDINNINPRRVRRRRKVKKPKNNNENNTVPESANNEFDSQNIPTENRGVNDHTGIPNFENYDQENVPQTGDNELTDTVEPNVPENYNQQEPSYLGYEDSSMPKEVYDINNKIPRRVRRRRKVKKPKNNNENNIEPVSANNESDPQNIPTDNRGVNVHTGIPDFENYDQEEVPQTGDNELTDTVEPNVLDNYNEQEPSYLTYGDTSLPNGVDDINNINPRRVRRRRRVKKPKNNNENNIEPESANNEFENPHGTEIKSKENNPKGKKQIRRKKTTTTKTNKKTTITEQHNPEDLDKEYINNENEQNLLDTTEDASIEDDKQSKNKLHVRRVRTYMVNKATNEKIPINDKTYSNINKSFETPEKVEKSTSGENSSEESFPDDSSKDDDTSEYNSSFLFKEYNSDQCKRDAYDKFKKVVSQDAKQIAYYTVLDTSEMRSNIFATIRNAISNVKVSKTFNDVDKNMRTVSYTLKASLKQTVNDLLSKVMPLARDFLKTAENLKHLYQTGPQSTHKMLSIILEDEPTIPDSAKDILKLISPQFDVDYLINNIVEKPYDAESMKQKKIKAQTKLVDLSKHMDTAISNIDCFILSAMATVGMGADTMKSLKSGRIIMSDKHPRAKALRDAVGIIRTSKNIRNDADFIPPPLPSYGVSQTDNHSDDDDDDEDPEQVAQKNEKFLKNVPNLDDDVALLKKVPNRRQTLGVIVVHPDKQIEYKEVTDTSELRQFVGEQTKKYKLQPKSNHPKFLKVNSKKVIDTVVENIKNKAEKNGMSRSEMVDEIIKSISSN